MQDKDYIKSIHGKIRNRKIKNSISGFSGTFAVLLAVFFTLDTSKEDLLFDHYYESSSVYEWEIIDNLTDDEIYDFLIDYTSLEEYDTIEDTNILEWIETINLGG